MSIALDAPPSPLAVFLFRLPPALVPRLHLTPASTALRRVSRACAHKPVFPRHQIYRPSRKRLVLLRGSVRRVAYKTVVGTLTRLDLAVYLMHLPLILIRMIENKMCSLKGNLWTHYSFARRRRRGGMWMHALRLLGKNFLSASWLRFSTLKSGSTPSPSFPYHRCLLLAYFRLGLIILYCRSFSVSLGWIGRGL